MTATVEAVAVASPPLIGASVSAFGYRGAFLVLLAPVSLLGAAQLFADRSRVKRRGDATQL